LVLLKCSTVDLHCILSSQFHSPLAFHFKDLSWHLCIFFESFEIWWNLTHWLLLYNLRILLHVPYAVWISNLIHVYMITGPVCNLFIWIGFLCVHPGESRSMWSMLYDMTVNMSIYETFIICISSYVGFIYIEIFYMENIWSVILVRVHYTFVDILGTKWCEYFEQETIPNEILLNWFHCMSELWNCRTNFIIQVLFFTLLVHDCTIETIILYQNASYF
jgi:hypothetical protein